MLDGIPRRQFVQLGAGALFTTATGFGMNADAATDPTDDTPKAPERDYPAPKFVPKFAKPILDLTLARDFVLFAHSDLEMVKKLHAKEPTLVTATVDWGGGDWESGLGGASHLGRRDIAEYLLANGARIDIFAAAMLGMLDVVKGILTAYPKLVDTKGPHGIPLLMHAKMGGKEAEKVFEYLQTLKPMAKPADKKPE